MGGSRFVSVAAPVSVVEDIATEKRAFHAAHPEASHHVSAYRLIDADRRHYEGDGEPRGTAGLALLKLLEQKKHRGVLLQVARYFGGTKLGPGRLTRAYRRAGLEALQAGGTATWIAGDNGRVALTYSDYGQVCSVLRNCGGQTEEERFESDVTLEFWLPYDEKPAFEGFIQSLTSGRGRVQWSEVIDYRLKHN